MPSTGESAQHGPRGGSAGASGPRGLGPKQAEPRSEPSVLTVLFNPETIR